ncbi:MAG: phosphoenolpyruvate--protein phosphotransferase [Candidatus Omnitrophica bacterium]|nr:phosphoenolpyruvate--protein phosphotransferase [Candidatus Omnitrophota bacterium]
MHRDHSKLICDISELTALFTDTANLDSLLQKIVEMIAHHMNAGVCSVYLYYEEADELVLKATQGLRLDSVGQVKLKLGEGLTGKALLEMRPVCEGNARLHPSFRLFTGIGEEKFCSFMAVPILRGQNRIGVMTLQSEQKDHFTAEDVNIFRAVTSQLANTIEMAKLLIGINKTVPDEKKTAVRVSQLKFVKGRSGAEGFAMGEAVVVRLPALEDMLAVGSEQPLTLEHLRAAVLATERQLESFQKAIETKLFDVASLIFSAQILMLKDQAMLGAMEALINSGATPQEAVRQVVAEYVARFDKMPNAFLREKRYDVIDVGRRLLENLVGVRGVERQYARKIVIARELLPSDALKLSTQGVQGVVLLSGGVTSHVAVLARSLNIPLIIADEEALLSLAPQAVLLLDGEQGNVYVDPEPGVVAAFKEKEALRKGAAQACRNVKARTLTKDGAVVHLLANINLLGDLAVAKDYQAEGVGLYRTEFPFIVRSDFPTEEEQYVIYRKLVEIMKGRPITFRTLDIGGDKALSYYDYAKEANPFLGLRSIRFSLRHQDVFAQQVRAILRAGAVSPVRIMFPMVSSLDDFFAARAVVVECAAQLKSSGIPHLAAPEIGVMIETPSAVEMSDELAREAAFFSVGTNDLIQYVLAVDRTNEKVADLYVPHHPSVLRALERTARAAVRHKKDISICGDMAHDPRYMPFLLGIGIRSFSVDARYILKIQERIMSLDTTSARQTAEKLLGLVSIVAIEKELASEYPVA